MVLLMLTRPTLAEPVPTIPAKTFRSNNVCLFGITTNMIASASKANNGTIISTRLFCTASPAMCLTTFFRLEKVGKATEAKALKLEANMRSFIELDEVMLSTTFSGFYKEDKLVYKAFLASSQTSRLHH